MNLRIKCLVAAVGLVALLPLVATRPAAARGIPDPGDPTPITIYGTITDHGVPMEGFGVVAWCGNLSNFGGWDDTDAHGYFEIHTTNSLDCPLGVHGFLEIFNKDNDTIAFADVTIHTQTLVNVKLENKNPVSVPEFEWVGGVVSLVAGAGTLAFGRWRMKR